LLFLNIAHGNLQYNMVTAIVLAAGNSLRMGTQNKLLLPFAGTTVIAAVVEQIVKAGLQELIVVTGNEPDLVEQALVHLPVKLIHNGVYGAGMTGSIQTGIQSATGNGYMICLGDMVLITAQQYAALNTAFEKAYQRDKACICLPRFNGVKGNPVIFSSAYKNAILQHDDPEGCKAIIQANNPHIVWVEMDDDAVLRDMDYPEDYAALINL